ncbi:MAG: tRNA (adenosine(37)-N6)-threonylcarbamoyltransferase complex ATPase subunit type 1 TsaE [Marinirhabdus sp.]|nr:tRNA (adenosine(37)-N6)-threonylcarbamoyltransferase complex ATPase subunit type 1 TsaE [Marinirhabdus sp.]
MELTYTLQDLRDVSRKVLEAIDSKIVLFYGDMGVGKTTLIKALASQLGVKEALNSPTFSIVNEHEIPNGILYHFDCYRIESEDEAFDIGIEDYFESGHWCFIEWPEKIENLIPNEVTKLKLTKNQNGSRTIISVPVN